MAEDRYGVILAGGSGTRFWPLSREERPKQLLDLFGDGTLLERAVRRLEGAVPPENLLVLTNERQREGVRRALPGVPAENIVAEPAKRDTAAAVALGAGWVARRNPRAVMAVLPADHLVRNELEFRRVVGGALEIARRSGQIVTLGVKPTWACPAYGYIEQGREAPQFALQDEGLMPREVVRFREKPNPDQAEEYLRQGRHAWNAGMFFFAVETLRRELARHAPALAEFVSELEGAPRFEPVVAERYVSLPRISFDYALMEKLERSLNLEATFDWDDVGSWISVAGYLEKDGHGNRHRGEMTALGASDNVVFSATGQHVALLGVSDLIVVQTGDALLIARRSSADGIKDLVDRLPEELR